MRVQSVIVFFSIVLFYNSCKNQEEAQYTQAEITEASASLNSWFDTKFDEDVAQSPQWQTSLGLKTNYGKWDDISSDQMAEDLKQAKARLDYLESEVDLAALDSVTQISYKLYKLNLENEIEDYEYRFYNYPVNQMFGLHASVPAFLINKHRIDSVADAKAYISRIKGVKPLFTELRNQLGIRETNQIVPPKFVLDRVLEDSQNILKGQPFDESSTQMPILADFQSKVEALDIDTETKAILLQEANQALKDSLQPAYEELITFIESQKVRATTDDGAWKFPRGDKF